MASVFFIHVAENVWKIRLNIGEVIDILIGYDKISSPTNNLLTNNLLTNNLITNNLSVNNWTERMVMWKEKEERSDRRYTVRIWNCQGICLHMWESPEWMKWRWCMAGSYGICMRTGSRIFFRRILNKDLQWVDLQLRICFNWWKRRDSYEENR